MLHIPAEFGPVYPALPTVEKFRKRDRKAPLSGDDAREYGEAVHSAIRALQRAALGHETPTVKTRCASGTSHNTGKAILTSIRKKHLSQLDAAVADERKRRTDKQIRDAYAAAMAEKRTLTV